MNKRQCNKSIIILTLLLITVVLSCGLDPINTGSSHIKTKDTTLPIESKKPHTSQIIAWESNGTVISSALGAQEITVYYPQQICSDDAGGAIMTWYDNRGSDYDIYAQKIDSNGNTQWTKNGTAICNATGIQIYPKICSDGAGGAIIIWQDNRSETSNIYDLYAQRINSDGKSLWRANGTVICNATGSQEFSQICGYENGTVIITWVDDRVNDCDTYAQKIDINGKTYWGESWWSGPGDLNGTVICNATNTQFYPTICRDGDGGAIITWYENRGFGSNNDIYAQKISSNGNTQWTKNGTAICNATFQQKYPKICYVGDGNAIITWHDDGNDDLYAQKIASDGKTLWTNNGTVICNATKPQLFPQICSDGAGGAIITWQDRRVLDYHVYAQHIDSNGDIHWGDDSIWGGKADLNGTAIFNVLGCVATPQICYDGVKGAIITWSDDRDGNYDIYAQKISSGGKTLWKSNGTLICNAEGNQDNVLICSDGVGGAIIMWADNRDAAVTGVDIYTQRIKPSKGGLYALADDDDDDEEEELNILLIVLIIVVVSAGALTIVIVVLIKKEVIQIPKSLQRKKT